MKGIVAKFYDQIEEALDIGAKAQLHSSGKQFNNVVVCGLGGSGIGGKIVAQLVKNELKVPFSLVNDYKIPAFINEKSLVIGSSYSGNTEETIATIKESETKGAEIAIITSGGALLDMAKEKNWNHIIVPEGEQPRAMLVYSIIQQLYLLKAYGLITGTEIEDIKKGKDAIKQFEDSIKEEAQKIAHFVNGKRMIIYADSEFEGLATRVRQQINENSKELCWHHVLPEMTHNELVGWAGGSDDLCPIYISTDYDHPRTVNRWDICIEVIGKYTPNILNIKAKGSTKIEQLFYIIHFTDWLSIDIAAIKNIDAEEVNVISYLKSEMAKK